jgi:hypothetical protein
MGLNIFHKVHVIDTLPSLPSDCTCLIGIDTNIGQGNAAVVALQNGDNIYVVDEYMGLALRAPKSPDDPPIADRSGLALSDWLKRWQARYPGRTCITCEEQGVSIADALESLGVTGIVREPWSGSLQQARIPLTVDLCDQDLIQFLASCNKTIEEVRKYYKDDKGSIPRQDDHHVDCLHHLIMARNTSDTIKAYNPIKSWI